MINKTFPRSSLLYPPALELVTSELSLSALSGVYRKSGHKNINFRPVYINKENSEYMFYQGTAYNFTYLISHIFCTFHNSNISHDQ